MIKNEEGTETTPKIKFEHHTRKFKCPVAIYTDFETFIEPTNNEDNELESSTTLLAELPP